MDILKIWNDNLSEEQARSVADRISEGELVILPTDSVYAIVCDALNPKAIARLCRIKGINPEKNQLSIMCADISMASDYARIDDEGFRLLKEYTPGPYTFLFQSGRNLPKVFKGRKVVGIRIPENKTACDIVRTLGNPVLTTSIDFEDEDHAREPEFIAETYRHDDISIILDAGEGGTEFTTIVDCTDSASPQLTREGKGEIFFG